MTVRTSLERIDWWGRSHRATPSFGLPSGAATWPSSGSLRNALKSTSSPRIGEWETVVDKECKDEWTAGCQGLVIHDGHLYVTQNSKAGGTTKATKGIYRLNQNFGIADRFTESSTWHGDADFDFYGGNHWGDLDARDGRLYVAVEDNDDYHHVVELDAPSLDFRATSPLLPAGLPDADDSDKSYPHKGGSFPWCAFNPWNGYLYTSNYDDVEAAYAYDPENNYRWVPEATIPLEGINGESYTGIQGGGFSENGHLYLSSYTKPNGRSYGWESDPTDGDWLFAFNGLNGRSMGRLRVPYGSTRKEMEGLTVGTAVGDSGDGYSIRPGESAVQVVLLDRRAFKNRVQFKSYGRPEGAVL